MNDKSPRQHLSKKSAKSLKQKRAEKRVSSSDANSELPSSRKPRNR